MLTASQQSVAVHPDAALAPPESSVAVYSEVLMDSHAHSAVELPVAVDSGAMLAASDQSVVVDSDASLAAPERSAAVRSDVVMAAPANFAVVHSAMFGVLEQQAMSAPEQSAVSAHSDVGLEVSEHSSFVHSEAVPVVSEKWSVVFDQSLSV
jgi:hypothetical protein